MKYSVLTDINTIYILGLIAVFVGVSLTLYGINRFFLDNLLERRKLRQRILGNQIEAGSRGQIFQELPSQRSPVLAIARRLSGADRISDLQKHLQQADIPIKPGTFVGLMGIVGSVGFILGEILGSSTWYCLGIGLITGYLPIVFLKWKKRRKALKFEKQMPEAMELLSKSLRIGRTLPATLEMLGQEVPAPLGKEMNTTYEEQRLGLGTIPALRRMAERVASRDLRFFVTAVVIQSETGGNLAELLENIGRLIRERLKLKGKVLALTAEGRFSALILSLLPVATFFMLFFVNRDYIMVLLTNPLGQKLLGVGIASIMLGVLVMKKMITIKV